MTPKERVEIALRGGKPDRVPIVPIYDIGYLLASIGHDQREFLVSPVEQRLRFIEESFLRHEVDGIFVHHMGTDEEAQRYEVLERHQPYWLLRDRTTGEVWRYLDDGGWAQEDGTPIMRAPSNEGVSRVRCRADIERLVTAPVLDERDIAGRFGALRHLLARYPDHHFSFQSGCPMVHALGHCGGYVEGLLTMAEDRELFGELLAACARAHVPHVQAGAAAGGHSTWFTSYYSGADTISPRDYAELVFPHDYTVCQAARDAGLFVLHWYLGDLMPMLDQVMELPMDALVLEQGRKGYDIDPVAIRKRVGSRFCLFGFGFEQDYCEFRRERLTAELQRQIAGAGRDGAFIVGTPIMPPNAQPEAVDHYFAEARRLGRY